MKLRYSIILVLLASINCNSNLGFLTGDVALRDIGELELTIGTTEQFSENEAMLVSPFSVAVNEQNDIMIVDSNIVRVYDQSGVRLESFGGILQKRSGGINLVRRIWVNPSGYISVFGGNFGSYAQFYKPDLSFIERKNYFVNPPYQGMLKSEIRVAIRLEYAFNIDETKKLFVVHTRSNNTFSSSGREEFLIYENNDKITTLARYIQTRRVPEVGEQSYDFLGVLLVDFLPDNRIVYMHSFHDSNSEDGESSYSIKIQSLDDLSIDTISRSYDPVEINWEYSELTDEQRLALPADFAHPGAYPEVIKKYLDERKYKVPVQKILTDNEFIFAFTYTMNNNDETLVDIFDSNSGEYVQSAYFRYVPDIIKNGYYYRINDLRLEGKRSVIEKYKIDPAVYGK